MLSHEIYYLLTSTSNNGTNKINIREQQIHLVFNLHHMFLHSWPSLAMPMNTARGTPRPLHIYFTAVTNI